MFFLITKSLYDPLMMIIIFKSSNSKSTKQATDILNDSKLRKRKFNQIIREGTKNKLT
jgi:hypothetical protein